MFDHQRDALFFRLLLRFVAGIALVDKHHFHHLTGDFLHLTRVSIAACGDQRWPLWIQIAFDIQTQQHAQIIHEEYWKRESGY
ncbi:hypothetical protein [Noviherbaspirillum sedimenti]|uniref:Uncharacterized protein n=1 Tax=Noviherbaspirillum sedimenti TaxID=2320865 RepID=A0A3A3GI93_9BURK|nr:hypothetical protein [Noviherbaspirillum sedimenti]RJG00620.1 hypothetical protein D3878_02690 [Noviherbaspirillum sedimenti]